jgi:hypothetical protein
MKRFLPFILVALVIGAWFVMRPSDEKKIAARFEAFSANISKGDKESPANMAIKAQFLDSLMAEEVKLSTSRNMLNGTFSREEFSSLIFRLRGMFTYMKLQFYDLQIVVDGEVAAVTGTAKLDMRTHIGEAVSEVREIDAKLVKVDGKWRFASFNEAQVLTK